jgi:hypothetical protein
LHAFNLGRTQLPPVFTDACKLQAIRLTEVPADVVAAGAPDSGVKVYQARLDFQLTKAKTMKTMTL